MPVQKYITKFKELQIELGPYALDDETALYKFLKGLNTQIRVFTTMSRPATFKAACEAAVANESSLNGTLGTRGASNNQQSDKMDLGVFSAQPRQNNQRNK